MTIYQLLQSYHDLYRRIPRQLYNHFASHPTRCPSAFCLAFPRRVGPGRLETVGIGKVCGMVTAGWGWLGRGLAFAGKGSARLLILRPVIGVLGAGVTSPLNANVNRAWVELPIL